jgi:monofunctional biosynthetic peptidoglycan transglycosylase
MDQPPTELPNDIPPSRLTRVRRWIIAHKLLTAVCLVSALLLGELATIPWFGVAKLARENPGPTALMRQREDEARSDGKPLRIVQSWIPLSKMPKQLIDAVVVAEDGTFYAHGGVDWFEVKESMQKNWDEKRAARGASTITQQLAKNLYLSTSKDPVRKAKVLLITLLLEHDLTKQRILEIYLNVIEWGRGIFGVDAAARTFFGKSASALTLEESLRLAAVIPSPLKHRPNEDTRYVMRRKEIVRNRMAARSMTGGAEADTTRADTTGAVQDSLEIDEGEGNGL